MIRIVDKVYKLDNHQHSLVGVEPLRYDIYKYEVGIPMLNKFLNLFKLVLEYDLT